MAQDRIGVRKMFFGARLDPFLPRSRPFFLPKEQLAINNRQSPQGDTPGFPYMDQGNDSVFLFQLNWWVPIVILVVLVGVGAAQEGIGGAVFILEGSLNQHLIDPIT